MLKLNPSRVVKIEFEGEVYEASPIKLGELVEIESLMEDEKGGAGKLTRELLIKCGLPAKMVDKLDGDQVQAVVEHLSPKKKK